MLRRVAPAPVTARPGLTVYLDGFWLGIVAALPVYWIADHLVIPYLVDEWRLRMHRARRHGR